MFKLAAVIRNHWVVFPHNETKTLSSRSARQMVTPIVRDAGNPSRSPGVVAANLLTTLCRSLRTAKIEAMRASVRDSLLSASTPPVLPDPTWASLACEAPAVCLQLHRMSP